MANTFTVGKGNYIRPFRNCRLRTYKEAASQTFKVGDVLILQTTATKGDEVKIAAADPTTGTVIGMAAAAASGTEGTLIPVWMLDEQSEFVAHIQDAATLDVNNIGVDYGVVADATNQIWRLDNTETTAKVFCVIALGPRPDGVGGNCGHGDTNGTYIVRTARGGQAVLKS